MKNSAWRLISDTKKFLTEFENDKPEIAAVAQQTAGGLLVADGLFGIRNPFNQRKSRVGIFGTLFATVVSALILVGMFFFGSLVNGDKMTETTTGKIMEVIQVRDTEDNSITCKPIVEFAVNGKTFKEANNMSSSMSCKLQVGDKKEIIYNPDNPKEWGIASEMETAKIVVNILKFATIAVLLMSIFQTILRAASIFFGMKLIRRGRQLAKAHPIQDNGQTANSIKQQVLTGLFGFSQNGGGKSGLLGGLLSFGKYNNNNKFVDNNNQQFGQNFGQQYGNQQFNNQQGQYGTQQQYNNQAFNQQHIQIPQQYNAEAQHYSRNSQQHGQQVSQQNQFPSEAPVIPPRQLAPRQAPVIPNKQQPQQNRPSGIADTSQRMGIQAPSLRPFRSEENTQPQRKNIPSSGFDNYYDDNEDLPVVEKEEYNPVKRQRPSTNTGSIPKRNPFA